MYEVYVQGRLIETVPSLREARGKVIYRTRQGYDAWYIPEATTEIHRFHGDPTF
jgi:hypothetical protein